MREIGVYQHNVPPGRDVGGGGLALEMVWRRMLNSLVVLAATHGSNLTSLGFSALTPALITREQTLVKSVNGMAGSPFASSLPWWWWNGQGSSSSSSSNNNNRLSEAWPHQSQQQEEQPRTTPRAGLVLGAQLATIPGLGALPR